MVRFWRSAFVCNVICPIFPPFRHTPPVVFTWPSIPRAYAKAIGTVFWAAQLRRPISKARGCLNLKGGKRDFRARPAMKNNDEARRPVPSLCLVLHKETPA